MRQVTILRFMIWGRKSSYVLVGKSDSAFVSAGSWTKICLCLTYVSLIVLLPGKHRDLCKYFIGVTSNTTAGECQTPVVLLQ
jgi:hypothetical protein